MTKKLLFTLLLIIILISACKKAADDTTRVIFTEDELNGGVIIKNIGYPCGKTDGVCPDDYSTHKPVCKNQDPDCI